LAESEAVRRQHGNQLSEVPNEPPDAVLFPETTGEVAEAVRICAKHRMPIIPFGIGSSFEGHINAPVGGLSLDTSRMKRIIAVHADDLDCSVEAGVTRSELNQHLRDTGLFVPIDPAPMLRSAAWSRPALPAPTRCATARCGTTYWR
jgi:D-lactate dehydrogenase (cytochrome)